MTALKLDLKNLFYDCLKTDRKVNRITIFYGIRTKKILGNGCFL